jgi:hypothetical protein
MKTSQRYLYVVMIFLGLTFIIGCNNTESPMAPEETPMNAGNSSLQKTSKKILFSDNFEDGDSQGWDFDVDCWNIETETGNYVLNSSTGSYITHATLQHPGWYDFRFESRIKFISGNTYCELRFRIDDQGQHYWLQVMDNRIALAKEGTTGAFDFLASAPMNILQNTWYDFEIAARDNKFKVKVNGSPKINVKDDDPWGNIGTIGFEVHDNTQVYFDDVLVTRLGGKK